MKKKGLRGNKLWEETKPSKDFKDWYRKMYGLGAESLYLATDKYWEIMENLLCPKKRK